MVINIQYNENNLLKIQTHFVQRLKLHQKVKKITTLRSPLHALDVPALLLIPSEISRSFLSLFNVFLVHDRLLLLL